MSIVIGDTRKNFLHCLNWELLQNRVKIVGLAAGFFGIGVWAEAIHDGSAKLPWLHQQAAVLSKVQPEVSQLKGARACEEWRANTASQLAKQPIMVDPSQIPKDYCPHPTVK